MNDYLTGKLLLLLVGGVIVFLAHFLFRVFTGRSLAEEVESYKQGKRQGGE